MTELRTNCPNCGTVLRTTNLALAGKKGKCPKCGELCQLPSLDRAPEEPAPKAVLGPLASGKRVLAQWDDGFWYPATVKARGPRGIQVTYDDSSEGEVPPDQIRDLDLKAGDRIFVRWQGGPSYFPGRLVKRGGEKIHVKYDDGHEETTTISMVRVINAQDIPWEVNDRVLAHWMPEPYFYPATITQITDDGIISVAYLDGDVADLVPGQVRALDIQEGDLIFPRRQQGRAYLAARILAREGDEIQVEYEDGYEEWTNISVIRILPAAQRWRGRARTE